jgi:hypothetical protein
MVVTVKLIFGISCRMLSTNQMSFRYALTCLVSCSLGLWSQISWAGEDWDCGDWACSIYGAAWVHSGEHRYQIYINENEGACDNLSHKMLTRNGENPLLEVNDHDVQFVFDDGSYIEVDVIFLDKDRIEFAPMNDTPKLENYLRDKNSFEIRSGTQIMLGSYGLWGSNRAISLVSCK